MQLFKRKKKIYYVVEAVNWVLEYDAIEITNRLKATYNLDIEICSDFSKIENIKDSIIHFSERNFLIPKKFNINPSNKIILTLYHGTDEESQYTQAYKSTAENLSFLHTSNEITKKYLEKWGVPSEKIVVIPIGLDINEYRPLSREEILVKRTKLNLPTDKYIIGSFQKDGNGWEEGNMPKMIKGPDVFCDTVEELNKRYPIFVLLTGPARGYVKNRLEKAGIPYQHFYEQNPKDAWKYYNILDLYIVGSRAEGGPKALTESQASGVPIVTTNVGMARDVIEQGESGFIADVEDVQGLVKYSSMIFDDSLLRNKLVRNGVESVKKFDFDIIVEQYYTKLYSSLL